MIQQTFDRIRKIVPVENIYVITNKEYIALTAEQLPEVNSKNIVGEPMMKNTAACNIYMAKKSPQKQRGEYDCSSGRSFDFEGKYLLKVLNSLLI